MLYIKRKIKKGKLKEIGNIKGLEITLRNKKGAIHAKKMIIVDDTLANIYSKKQLDKKFKKLYDFIYKFLTSEDNSEDGVKACLGEIEKVKQELFNKYKEFLKNKEYKEFITKIVITENEFKNKYFEREYLANIIKSVNKLPTNAMYEEMEKGRSR